MAAGRPRKFEIGMLYGYAQHFYWDLKTVDEPKRKTVYEGLSRYWVDRKERARLLWKARKDAKLKPEALADLEREADRQIQKGFLPAAERETFIRESIKSIEFDRRFRLVNRAREDSRKLKTIPGEPEIIDALLSATTPDQIREIAADALPPEAEDIKSPIGPLKVMRPNWPISGESRLPSALSQYASEFIEAKNDPRFPKSGRPTSRRKQLWFLSRALAGAAHGLKTRTAINLIGSVRPDEGVMLSKISKRSRHPKKTTRKQS